MKIKILILFFFFLTCLTAKAEKKLEIIQPSYVNSEAGVFLKAGNYTVKFQNTNDLNNWIQIASSFSKYDAEKRYSFLLIFRLGVIFSHRPIKEFTIYKPALYNISQTDPEPIIRQEAIKLYGKLSQEEADLYRIISVYIEDKDPTVKNTALESFYEVRKKIFK